MFLIKLRVFQKLALFNIKHKNKTVKELSSTVLFFPLLKKIMIKK